MRLKELVNFIVMKKLILKLLWKLEIHLKTSGEDGKMMSQGKNKLFGIFLLLLGGCY